MDVDIRVLYHTPLEKRENPLVCLFANESTILLMDSPTYLNMDAIFKTYSRVQKITKVKQSWAYSWNNRCRNIPIAASTYPIALIQQVLGPQNFHQMHLLTFTLNTCINKCQFPWNCGQPNEISFQERHYHFIIKSE